MKKTKLDLNRKQEPLFFTKTIVVPNRSEWIRRFIEEHGTEVRINEVLDHLCVNDMTASESTIYRIRQKMRDLVQAKKRL